MDGSNAATLERLRFRNGFLVHDAALEASAPAGWRRMEAGGLAVHAHPDTAVHLLGEGAGPHAIAFGEAFDPDGELDPAALFAELHRTFAQQGRDALLDRLDAVVGRFALLVGDASGWEAFHDAMGSRSLFYHRGRPILASHAELIAQPLSLRSDDFFIPFLTSRNYVRRDVKYLPGLATPYAELRQLSPNTSLSVPSMAVARYWPRRPVDAHADLGRAARRLAKDMAGLAAFMRARRLRPVLGLTGGLDSRGLFAALHEHDPFLFTFVRSDTGEERASPDSDVAARIAARHGLDLNVFPIKTPATLSDADNSVSRAFREATAYYRGIDSGWLHPLIAAGLPYRDAMFVRGFGGEILRGFYQPTKNRVRRVSPGQFANAYDVNAGSRITKDFFAEQIELTGLTDERLMGYDPSDVFYWEHRMGTWGSIAMAEADIAQRSIVGYNSRRLYEAFLGLSYDLRASRRASLDVIARMAPRIADLETV